jgi:hypothetical protein
MAITASRANRALRLAVKSQLITSLSLNADGRECACTVDGRPWPMCGQKFVAVHPGPVSNRGTDHHDELHSVLVTVTFRSPVYPTDREDQLLDLDEQLDEYCDKVAQLIHDLATADAIRVAANVTLAAEDATQNGFTEPLRYRGTSQPAYRGPEWFRSEPGNEADGVSRTMVFQEARRLIRV